jgi:hypothetical protein
VHRVARNSRVAVRGVEEQVLRDVKRAPAPAVIIRVSIYRFVNSLTTVEVTSWPTFAVD